MREGKPGFCFEETNKQGRESKKKTERKKSHSAAGKWRHRDQGSRNSTSVARREKSAVTTASKGGQSGPVKSHKEGAIHLKAGKKMQIRELLGCLTSEKKKKITSLSEGRR